MLISGTFVVGSANAEPLQDANISVSASEDVSAGISRDHIAELDDVGLESETEVGIVASSKVTDTKLKLSAAATGIVNLSEDIEARKIRLKNLAKYKLGGGWDAVLSYEPTWSLALDSNESTLRRDKFKIAFKYKKTWLSAGTCMGGSENDPCSELNVDLGYSETYKPNGKVSRVPSINLVWTKPFGLEYNGWDVVFEFSDQTDELELQLENELIEDFELSEKLALVHRFKSDPVGPEDLSLEFYAKHAEAYSNANFEEPEDTDRWSAGVKLSFEATLMGED